jgi:uncharacterized damage-inducible protein DinB
MSESERITDQLKRAFEGPAWHGASVLETLAGITAAQAARRPIAAAHSIWELVLHMTVWEDAVRRRALGEKYNPTDEQDWPKVTDTSEAAWQEAIARLKSGHQALRGVVAAFDPERLEAPLVPGGNTGYVQFHGAVQHDLWHAGQIMVLKKG